MMAGADNSVSSTTTTSDRDSSSSLRSFFLNGPAGRLEALLNEGKPDAPFATLVCHPHPKGGGTMHNKVVYHAAKVFSGRGWPVLRFNFRGTGLSEGEHSGHAEFEDVVCGLEWLSNEFRKPIVAAGFSFGAAMGLKAAKDFPGIAGFAALGLPTQAEGRHYSYGFLPDCHFPKIFLSGDRDQYAPVGELQAITRTAANPWQFVTVHDGDHFFTGHLPAMQSALGDWLAFTYPPSRSTSSTGGSLPPLYAKDNTL